jgi:flagellar basal-body rod protein FlgB
MKWEAFADRTMGVLEKALFWQNRRQEIIAGNVANLDTPNFTGKDLDFQQVLRRQLAGRTGPGLTVTNPTHLGEGPRNLEGQVKDTDEPLDLNREMGRMAENQVLFQSSVQMLLKKLEMVRNAMEGGTK